MSNLRIGYQNRAASAALVASPDAVTTMPVTYLQTSMRGKVFRSTSTAAQDFILDWGGTAYDLNMVAFNRTNLVDGDTWRIQLYSDVARTISLYDSTTVAVFASGLFSGWDYSFCSLYFPLMSGVKAIKITVNSPTNPAGYMQMSSLFVGQYIEAQYNPVYGMSFGFGTDEQGERRREGALDMVVNSDAQHSTWFDFGRECQVLPNRTPKSFWISKFPGIGGVKERNHAGMFRLAEDVTHKLNGLTRYDFSLSIIED